MKKDSNFYKMDVKKGDKRRKLAIFASVTFIILTMAAVYFEVYYQRDIPPFLRVFLASYWFYSIAGMVAAVIGSDKWVSKLYLNVS